MTIFQQFKDFVATRSGSYDFWDTRNCALAQFGKQYFGHDNVAGCAHDIVDYKDAPYGNHVQVIPYTVSPIVEEPWTFEALAERLAKIEETV